MRPDEATIVGYYIKALGSGMFWVWFPELTGNWQTDKEAFIASVESRKWLWNEQADDWPEILEER